MTHEYRHVHGTARRRRFASRTVLVGLLLLPVGLGACGGSGGEAAPAAWGPFGNAERVTILGYAEDVMEPFLGRDGRYLFFNNSNAPTVQTDLHYAERLYEAEAVLLEAWPKLPPMFHPSVLQNPEAKPLPERDAVKALLAD